MLSVPPNCLGDSLANIFSFMKATVFREKTSVLLGVELRELFIDEATIA